MTEREKLAVLSRELTKLKDSQIEWLISIVAQFNFQSSWNLAKENGHYLGFEDYSLSIWKATNEFSR